MDGECAPLCGGGVEIGVLHVEVPGGYGLGAEAVEEGDLCSARDTN